MSKANEVHNIYMNVYCWMLNVYDFVLKTSIMQMK